MQLYRKIQAFVEEFKFHRGHNLHLIQHIFTQLIITVYKLKKKNPDHLYLQIIMIINSNIPEKQLKGN